MLCTLHECVSALFFLLQLSRGRFCVGKNNPNAHDFLHVIHFVAVVCSPMYSYITYYNLRYMWSGMCKFWALYIYYWMRGKESRTILFLPYLSLTTQTGIAVTECQLSRRCISHPITVSGFSGRSFFFKFDKAGNSWTTHAHKSTHTHTHTHNILT